MPQVSVLMTIYNSLPHLRPAVESVLAQTHQDFHFVIVNDGSTDDSSEYLKSLADPRITLIEQPNQGTAAAANHGLKYIESEFIARMDGDDIALPDRLAKQLAFMLANPDTGIVGAQIAPIGDQGVGGSLQLPTSHQEIFSNMMAGRHGLAHSSIMIRTRVLKDLGGYWSLPLIDDWDMMLRVGELSQLANLNEVLLHYRVHTGSLNGQNMKRMHRHISYAIERAKHRQSGMELPTYEAFERQLDQQPVWKRAAESIHVYALANYRLAIAEIHGGQKIRGTARLAWSALCSPSRTWHRFGRILGRPFNS